MKQQIVAIRDRAVDAFMRPFFVPALGAAIRAFGDEVNRKDDPNNGIAQHPDDYDLYHLGSFDDNTGRFELLEQPMQIAIGKQMKGA